MDKVEHSPQHPRYQSFDNGYLAVSDGHTLYYEQAGNPDGAPVVCLHGGPGAGSNAWTRRFFDLDHYRIIQFDQRGAGKSTPSGGLEANTTPHLVADIEALREALGLPDWLVFGGSWGATLALAYLGAHPSRVRGMILRGAVLGSGGRSRLVPRRPQAILPRCPSKLAQRSARRPARSTPRWLSAATQQPQPHRSTGRRRSLGEL